MNISNDSCISTPSISKNHKNRSDYFKQYREKNHEKIKDDYKKYYNSKKDIIYSCDFCNCQIKGFAIYKHRKSKKHLINFTQSFLSNHDI